MDDIANWTSLRMRQMHRPIKEGKFMAGGKTPHQYLTAEIEALVNSEITATLARVLEKKVTRYFSNPVVENKNVIPVSAIEEELEALKEQKK